MTPSTSAVTTLMAPPSWSLLSGSAPPAPCRWRGARPDPPGATGLLQGVGGRDVRGGAAGAGQFGQFGHIARSVVAWWRPNPSMVKPVTTTPLSRTRLSGIRGISPEANPTVTNRPPQRMAAGPLGVRPSDRIDDHVGPVAGDLLHPRLEVLGRVVDRPPRLPAPGRAPSSRPRMPPTMRAPSTAPSSTAAGPRRRPRRAPRPTPRLDPGHAAQGVVRRGMGHPEAAAVASSTSGSTGSSDDAGTAICSAKAPNVVDPSPGHRRRRPRRRPPPPGRCRRTHCPP